MFQDLDTLYPAVKKNTCLFHLAISYTLHTVTQNYFIIKPYISLTKESLLLVRTIDLEGAVVFTHIQKLGLQFYKSITYNCYNAAYKSSQNPTIMTH
jgi:hypothetical protein